MKKSLHTVTIGATAIVACLITTTVFVAKNNSSFINEVKADETTLTLNNDQLKQIELEDINLKGEGEADDKAFRIELGGPRYIDGAILFRDCGHQFTGNTLGDPFGIDNRGISSINAYNFNIVFALERSDSLTVDLTETSLTSDGSEYSRFDIKWTTLDCSDLYNTIRAQYNSFVNRTGIYSSWAGQKLQMTETTRSFENYSQGAVGFRALVLQCSYSIEDGQAYNKYYVRPGNLLTFTLNKISIGYHCA